MGLDTDQAKAIAPEAHQAETTDPKGGASSYRGLLASLEPNELCPSVFQTCLGLVIPLKLYCHTLDLLFISFNLSLLEWQCLSHTRSTTVFWKQISFL